MKSVTREFLEARHLMDEYVAWLEDRVNGTTSTNTGSPITKWKPATRTMDAIRKTLAEWEGPSEFTVRMVHEAMGGKSLPWSKTSTYNGMRHMADQGELTRITTSWWSLP